MDYELTTSQIITINGLSLESILSLPICNKEYLSNRYIRSLRQIIITMAISYYNEEIICKYMEYHNENILLINDILESEDVLDEIKDEVRIITDIFDKFV